MIDESETTTCIYTSTINARQSTNTIDHASLTVFQKSRRWFDQKDSISDIVFEIVSAT